MEIRLSKDEIDIILMEYIQKKYNCRATDFHYKDYIEPLGFVCEIR